MRVRLFVIGFAFLFLGGFAPLHHVDAIGASTLSGTCSPTQVTLSWTPVEDANSNAIQRGWDHPDGSYWEFFFTSDIPPFDTYSLTDTDLQPNTVYEYRVKTDAQVSSNIFRCDTTIPALKPSAVTNTATNITTTGAKFLGTVNPNGAETEVWFEYGDSVELGSETAKVSVGSGKNGLQQSATVSGLSSDTTYYFRIVASNSIGTAVGNIFTLKTAGVTPPPPGAPTATLRVNDTRNSITVDRGSTLGVQWTSERATSCTISPDGWTGTSGSRSKTISANTLFQLSCTGGGGTATDRVQVTVRTSEPPEIPPVEPPVEPPPSAERPSADLKVNGSDGPLTIAPTEELSLEWNSMNARNCTVNPGGFGGVYGSENIGSITNETDFVIVCTGDGGSATDRVSVTVSRPAPVTVGRAPSVSTLAPSDYGLDYAVVNGYVNPNGAATAAWFEYGASQSVNRVTNARSIGSGRSAISFSAEIVTETGREYFYRIVARNAHGVSRGQVKRVVSAGSALFAIEPAFKNLKADERVQFRAWYDADGSGPRERKDVTADTIWISENTSIAYHDKNAAFLGKGMGETKVFGIYSPDGRVMNVNDIANLKGEATIVIDTAGQGGGSGSADVSLITAGSTNTIPAEEQRSHLLRNALWGFLIVLLIVALIFGITRLNRFLKDRAA
jgi:hypothetical protein